jgi:hypothetical protein
MPIWPILHFHRVSLISVLNICNYQQESKECTTLTIQNTFQFHGTYMNIFTKTGLTLHNRELETGVLIKRNSPLYPKKVM